jgi:IclR family transcriptional regulator, mhp operon transcriptional activator
MLNSSSGLVAFAYAPEGERAMLRHLLTASEDKWNRERASNEGALDLLVQPVLDNGFAFQPPPNNNPEQSIAFPIFIGGRYVASLLMIYMTQAMNSAQVVARYAPHLRTLASRIGAAAEAQQDLDSVDEIDFPPFQALPPADRAVPSFARP